MLSERLNSNLLPRTDNFEELAIAIFEIQAKANLVYSKWLALTNTAVPSSIEQIPFLPIELFKRYEIKTNDWIAEATFLSSGTTSMTASKHLVKSMQDYLENATSIFKDFYGSVDEYCFLGLCPSYLERQGSSLIAMIDHFVKKSKYNASGFYLYNHADLYQQLVINRDKGVPTVLFAVSFAVLDFLEQYRIDFPELIIIETGGMKGRRKEITREELHQHIKQSIPVAEVHSEYGMTELFSQAYSQQNGVFKPGKTMKVLAADMTDPLHCRTAGRGTLNIIDLANFSTCSFIATQDIGNVLPDGNFQVLGRLDSSELRGCNLMLSDV